jgi:hypothetical protein
VEGAAWCVSWVVFGFLGAIVAVFDRFQKFDRRITKLEAKKFAVPKPSHYADAMVRFCVSPQIEQLLKEYNAANGLSENDSQYVSPTSQSIEHLQVVNILSLLNQRTRPNESKYTLNEILRSTSLFLDIPPKKGPVRTLSTCISHSRLQNIKQEWTLSANV